MCLDPTKHGFYESGMATYIFFDIGMVLLNNGNGAPAWEAVAARSDRGDGTPYTPEELLEKYVRENTLLGDYSRGQVSTESFLVELKAITGYQGGLDELAEDFSKTHGPIDANTRIFEYLKNHPDFTIGIISDTVEIHMAALARDHGFLFEQLDGLAVIFSYHADIQAQKHEGPEIFEKALTRIGADPARDRVFMIDDRWQNQAGAQAAGMTFILLLPGDDLAEKLRAHGIETAAPRPPAVKPGF